MTDTHSPTRDTCTDIPWPVLIVLAASIVLYAVGVIAAHGFTIDDAYISARYAKNLAESGQLTWNVGEIPKIEGYTSPLWVLLSAILFLVTDSFSFGLLQLMSIFFGACALFMSFALACRMRISSLSAPSIPLFLSVTPPFVLWSASGMENALYIFLVLLGLFLVIGEEDKGLNYITPLVLFLVFFTRTEGLVFYLSVVLVRSAKYLFQTDSAHTNLRKFLIWNAVFWSCLSVYLLWKIFYYEAVLPLPVLVKKAADLTGFGYVVSLTVYLAPFILLALLGLRRSWNENTIYLWCSLGAYLLAISLSNPLMGWDYRLLSAAFPLVYVLAVVELDLVVGGEKAHGADRLVFVLVAGLLFVTVLKDPGDYLDSLRRRATASAQVIGTVHIPLGKWLDSQSGKPENKTVALADAGAIAFYFEGDVVDFYGLNDRQIASKGFSVGRILDRNPDYVILNSRNDTTFQGNDSFCGQMSDELFAAQPFQEHYTFVKQFVSYKPFYSLWVYKRNRNITKTK